MVALNITYTIDGISNPLPVFSNKEKCSPFGGYYKIMNNRKRTPLSPQTAQQWADAFCVDLGFPTIQINCVPPDILDKYEGLYNYEDITLFGESGQTFEVLFHELTHHYTYCKYNDNFDTNHGSKFHRGRKKVSQWLTAILGQYVPIIPAHKKVL